MRRREFITLVGCSLLASLLAARAQSVKRRLIATLALGSRAGVGAIWEEFWQGLRALGHSDQELAIESRWADGHAERLPGLAAELVRLAPDVIVVGGGTTAEAAKQATSTIPIVMLGSNDPVGAGLVASIARPGGNVTGLSTMLADTAEKELEFLKTAVPRAGCIAVLINPGNPAHAGVLQAVQQAARTLSTELLSVEIHAFDEIDSAFATMTRGHADGLVVLGDPLFTSQASRIADLATSHSLPSAFYFREFVAAGGLLSYGPNLKESARRAAFFVDKILKGAAPADLPVEQPTKFELVINLKTARSLGLTIPPILLARADEVIE
jgi:putative ABC transport system substrate-binding protein